MKLTDKQLKNAKPGSTKAKLFDGGGLYLIVMPNGAKLWRWDYRTPLTGKQRTMSFGAYPEISLADAREKHADGRKLLRTGVDPMAERQAERMAIMAAADKSFESVATAWHKKWAPDKDAVTATYVLRRMQADVFPAIGHLPITQISTPAIVAIVKKIEERGAVEIARRVLANISQVFRYAIAHGLIDTNPAANVKPSDILKGVTIMNYARIESAQFPVLMQRIDLYQGTPITRLAMKLLAHTFVRTSELIEAPWTEFNFEKRQWIIPPERMKMATPHMVPLATQTIEILKSLYTLTGRSTLLLPGERDPKASMSNNTILKALERMGYKGVMTGHGFRGLASTILHENGFEHEHIELQLAHMQRNKVSAAYNHARYLAQRTAMMQWWADYIEKAQREAMPSTGPFAVAG